MNSEKLEGFVKKAQELISVCDFFPDNRFFFEQRTRLESAIDFCRDQNLGQPLVVTLIGGTGTGKSYIFSRLYGKESASPSSDSVRGFTKTLFAAASENDRPFLNFGENVEFLPGILDGSVLVDSPDIDSIQKDNLTLSKRMIQMSDLLVYVTTPDKRSNFDINQTILNWASRKRWLFVMNKIDTATDVSMEKLKKDFCEKIAEMGFKKPELNTFLFSARDENSFEFNKFKDLVFSNRSFKQNSLIKETACLRNFRFSIKESPTLGKIAETLQTTSEYCSKIENRLMETQRDVLKQSDLEKLADSARSEAVFRQLSHQRTLFMFPYIFVANFLHSGVSANDLAFAFTRKLREAIPYTECIKDELRVIEDLRLRSGKKIEGPVTQEEMFSVQELKNNLAESAIKVANSRTVSLYLFLANLLPFFILAQALFRAFSSWMSGLWLPTDFFLHASMLVMGSTIPGYLLFIKGVTRLSEDLTLATCSSNLTPGKLELARNSLSDYLKLSSEFCDQLELAIKSSEKQIEPDYAGTTVSS